MNLIKQYPVRFYGVIVSAVALVTAFGVSLTAEQTGAVTAFVAAVLSLVTERFTTPA